MKPRAKKTTTRAQRTKSTTVPKLDLDDIPFEFAGLRPTTVASSAEHSALCAAIIVLLGSRTNAPEARPYAADLRLRVPETGFTAHADACVIWGPPARDPEAPAYVTNPTVIVEVTSAETEDYDRDEKRLEFQKFASLREYVLVSQDEARVDLFVRSGQNDFLHTVSRLGDAVRIASIGVFFGVEELYDLAGL